MSNSTFLLMKTIVYVQNTTYLLHIPRRAFFCIAPYKIVEKLLVTGNVTHRKETVVFASINFQLFIEDRSQPDSSIIGYKVLFHY